MGSQRYLVSRNFSLSQQGSEGLSNPLLCGWAVARPQTLDHRMRSANVNQDGLGPVLAPNLYRHPERYNQPIEGYKNEHDIYALGIVLFEIGLWTTMSMQIAKPIAIASSRRDLPPVSLKHSRLLELSRSPKLKQEKGSEYAEVVERCLTSAFEVEKDDEKSTALISKLRSLVVKPLNYGISLYVEICFYFFFVLIAVKAC